MDSIGLIDYIVIGVYLIMMLLIGVVFKRFNRNSDDFIRSGCKASWWMAGASGFMTAFSAWTFTGAAGAAYEAGWSFAIIFFTNALGFLIHAIWLAPWFRQLRAASVPEVVRRRFNVFTQQYIAYLGSLTGTISAAITLYGLAMFTSTVFNFRIDYVIIGLGCVVMFYSVMSGNWAVMATDFIQAIILFPLTIFMAILSLREIGGISGLLNEIQAQGLTSHYQLFNDGQFNERVVDFTLIWAVGITINRCCGYMGISAGRRYFAVKDGKEARKAAWLAFALMILGTFIWIIPPMVARLKFHELVMSMGGAKPAETAYAVISMKLLPQGMVGLMIIAMFSATMSSMDTGLNTNAARFINDIYPALCRWLKKKPIEGKKLLYLAQGWTMILGVIIVILALNFSNIKGVGVFRLMQELGAVFGSVIGVPMLLGLFIKKTPPWAAMVAMLIAAIPSLMGYMSGSEMLSDIPALATPWKMHFRIMINSSVGVLVFVLSMLFYKNTSQVYKAQVSEFFKIMRTPVDFEKEVGGAVDTSQMLIVGVFTSVIGFLICFIAFIPKTWGIDGRGGILLVGGIILTVGLILFGVGYNSYKNISKCFVKKNS